MTMKGSMSWSAIVLVSLFLCIGFAECEDEPNCGCSYHPGGCVIKYAAPPGFKCKCHYAGAWTCHGAAFPCTGNESCPGLRADYCACKLGGGNCGGYKNPHDKCPLPAQPTPGVARSAQCDCDYHSGGCMISKATPMGWKCVCPYKGFWRCSGWAVQCSEDEYCPGNDYSYCACQQGGGDCGAYSKEDRKAKCPPKYVPAKCDCNKATDWSKGMYTIEKITYSLNDSKTGSFKPITLSEKDIRNLSTEKQTITFEVQETLTETSTFSRTDGIQIQAGVEFEAGIPYLGESKVSISITSSQSLTFGKTSTITTNYKTSFTCNGAPHKHTQCSVIVQKGKLSVPYTMAVKHTIMNNCTCESNGVWSGVQEYDARMISKEVGNCTTSACE